MNERSVSQQRLELELAGLLMVGDAAWEFKDRLRRYHKLFRRQGAHAAATAAARLIAAIDADAREQWQPALETLRRELARWTEAA